MKVTEPEIEKEVEEDEYSSQTPVGEFMQNTSWLDTRPEQEVRIIHSRGTIRRKRI